MDLTELNQSTLMPQQPSIAYLQQLASVQLRAANGDSLSGIQEDSALSASVLTVAVSNHGASTPQVDQFLAWVSDENSF